MYMDRNARRNEGQVSEGQRIYNTDTWILIVCAVVVIWNALHTECELV